MAPLLLPHLLLLLAVADALPPPCSEVVTCGDHVVRYPFSLTNSSKPDCGYPGLGLVCERNGTLILPVQSHRYRVFRIDYQARTVMVSDASIDEYAPGCPRLRVNLTIDATSSWLQLTNSDSNITFIYNCKKNISLASAWELSGCQQDGKRSYVLPAITGAEAYEYECEELVVAPVFDMHKKAIVGTPRQPPENASFDEVLQGGFELNYDVHSQQCDGCERSGGWCGYRHNQTHGGMNFTCFCDGGPTAARCGKMAAVGDGKSYVKIAEPLVSVRSRGIAGSRERLRWRGARAPTASVRAIPTTAAAASRRLCSAWGGIRQPDLAAFAAGEEEGRRRCSGIHRGCCCCCPLPLRPCSESSSPRIDCAPSAAVDIDLQHPAAGAKSTVPLLLPSAGGSCLEELQAGGGSELRGIPSKRRAQKPEPGLPIVVEEEAGRGWTDAAREEEGRRRCSGI